MAGARERDGVYSVSQITARLKRTLQQAFPAVWVRGEMTNYRVWSSGQAYFTLSEGKVAALDCMMWRDDVRRLSFDPADGIQVEAYGAITVYEARGRMQLEARELRPAGMGELMMRFEALKRRLDEEGLFDTTRKRPLPAFPSRIGVVTSPVGAAVRDITKVLRARWPSIGVVLAPVRVQGEGAATQIAAAIERFNRYGAVDVLIVGRGGGSIEDLWAFNEEPVVRGIAASHIPVISAVGHEVDVTLADFAADVRAATPSNAAELAVRERASVALEVTEACARLEVAAIETVRDRRRWIEDLLESYGFRRYTDLLHQRVQRVDDLWGRLEGAAWRLVASRSERLHALARRHERRDPRRVLGMWHESLTRAGDRLAQSFARTLDAQRRALAAFGDRLRALSPRHVLERGFCIVRTSDGRVVRAADALAVGERVDVTFARGEAGARIEELRTEEGA